MQLENSFTVPVPIDEAWRVLLDIERIAPCMPGAALDSVTGDDFTGRVKVKLGPINLTYQGKASFIEKDEANHKAVIDAVGTTLLPAIDNAELRKLVVEVIADQTALIGILAVTTTIVLITGMLCTITSNWSSGFLPSTYSGTQFRSEGDPVLNLGNPTGIDAETQAASIATVR